MFTKKVRVGTRGVGVAQPVYKDVTDWGAVAGAIVIGLIVLALLGSL
jgi:hypothetical protein